MDEQAFNKAKQILKDRRSFALEKQENALLQYKNNPEYADLDKNIRLNILQMSKALSQGQDTTLFEKKDAELQQKKNELLKKQNLKQEFFFCPICKDTGILKNGRFCSCFVKVYKQILRNMSGVNELPHFTFEDNNIANINCSQSNALQKCYNSMQKFCNDFPNTSVQNILIRGKVGIGKSCLLSASLNAILDRGFDAQYTTAFKLNSTFLKYHTSDIKTRQTILQPLIDADILFIDDLGAEPLLKNVSIEYLTYLLDVRRNKHNIVATNLTLEELQNKYDQRVFSRLTAKDTTLFLSIDGDDLRIKK